MQITFLGTNGWYDSHTGNTPSALIETSTHYIVLDAGFGIAKLVDFIKTDKPIFIFISHFHIDHICGLHTLAKLQKLKNKITIFGQKGLKKYFNIFVNHPFSASVSELKLNLCLEELKPGKHNLSFEVICLPLKHADPSMGYRMNLDGKIIAYCSDTAVCPNDAELAKDADLFIHECAFLPNHGPDKWGHTEPAEAGQLARDAGAKKLILTHLGADGYNSKEKRNEAERVARNIFPQTTVAFDGMTVEI